MQQTGRNTMKLLRRTMRLDFISLHLAVLVNILKISCPSMSFFQLALADAYSESSQTFL